MRKPLKSLFSRTGVLVLLALPAPYVLADRAEGAALQAINADMLRIAEAFLATVAGPPGGIETAVGYNRHELLALEHTDAARPKLTSC